MDSTSSTQGRNELFQKLKPWCVKVSQLAIREQAGPATARELSDLIDQVLSALHEQLETNPLVLDEKLAEYVFFPLYHIFRQMDDYPMPLIESCLKCLTILIVHGWRTKISGQLVQQVLSLLTFIIDGKPGATNKRTVDEETTLEAFRGLTGLLTTAGRTPTTASSLSETEAIPALGHGVSVMLDGVTDGATPQIQQEALRALQAVYGAIREHAAVASFLPGTMSSLSNVLSTPTRYKQSVLSRCLDTVRVVLTRVLSDINTRSILAKMKAVIGNEDENGKILSPAWLKATSIQVKRALLPMMKLRSHSSPNVRGSLNKLCLVVLDECYQTLSNCTTILLETAMILDEGEKKLSLTETSLKDLISIYPELNESAKTTTYNWMSSLPRLLQSTDEDVKQSAIRNVMKGLELLGELRVESTTLEDTMVTTIRDSVLSLVSDSKPQPSGEGPSVRLIDSVHAPAETHVPGYPPVLLPAESQKRVRDEITSLINFLGSSPQKFRLASNMLEQMQNGNSSTQVTVFWICFQLVKANQNTTKETNEFLDLGAFIDSPDELDMISNELYSMSVQILDRHSGAEPVDWRLEAIALEVTAWAAQQAREGFRPELIDVLFPVATFLGSKNPSLQNHGIITLNNIAMSCGYDNVSDLIVDNVDYMVNSVALRLNTLDISLASTIVLTMMIRLAGPRLIPYLDDVVESIFAALDNYHGYPVFVESLFTVLKEVVDQGVKSNMLLPKEQKAKTVDHLKRPAKPDGCSKLLALLERREKQKETTDDETASHPKTPWRRENESNEAGEDSTKAEGAEADAGEDEKPPQQPTYQLLLRVANLTQHYLTSPTPSLRRSLLEVLTTASPALAPDEDAFLPLVNAVWPTVIGRLQDEETYVVIEACNTLVGLCVAAGDFLSSRFKTAWHEWLRDWCTKAQRQAAYLRPQASLRGEVGDKHAIPLRILSPGSAAGAQTSIRTHAHEDMQHGLVPLAKDAQAGGLGQFSSPAKIWEATLELLTALVQYVWIDDEMFDDVLDLVMSAANQKSGELPRKAKEALDALEIIDGDAVWLAKYERGLVEWMEAPRMDGVVFAAMKHGAK